MEQKKPESQELTELCARVDRWRSGGGGRGSRIPEELWQEAVRVAGIDGLYATAKATRIKYDALKERCAQGSPAPAGVAGQPQRSPAVAVRGTKRVPPTSTGRSKGLAPAADAEVSQVGARFVTLQVATPPPNSQMTIELVGRQGDRMRVECAGPVDVVGLVQTWWSRSS